MCIIKNVLINHLLVVLGKCSEETIDQFLESNKENTNQIANRLSPGKLEMELVFEKRKQRRSMLGQRTYLYNNTNITINVDPEPQVTQEKSIAPMLPDQTKTSPQNPFGYEEKASTFFESEINDIGAWSVFKSKQTSIKSPNQEKEVRRSTRLSTTATSSKKPVRKEFKTKLFDGSSNDQFHNSRRNNEKSNRKSLSKTMDSNTAIDSARWPRNKCGMESLKTLKEEMGNELETDTQSSKGSDNTKINKYKHDQQSDYDSDNESQNVNSSPEYSYLPSIKKSARKVPSSLNMISEVNENFDPLISTSSNECIFDSNDNTLCDENSVQKHLKHLNELCFTVEKHSNNIDKILAELFNEKKVYNTRFNSLQKAIRNFEGKFKPNGYCHDNAQNSIKEKKKNSIISSKLKRSPALMLSPGILPSNKKNKDILQSFSTLRESFTYLQTPDNSSYKQKKPKKSVCYTPNSLSMCLNEQLKCLDS